MFIVSIMVILPYYGGLVFHRNTCTLTDMEQLEEQVPITAEARDLENKRRVAICQSTCTTVT